MATFPTITQNGGVQTWVCSGGNITNHEVFAFTLQRNSVAGTGAFLNNLTVFIDAVETSSGVAEPPVYMIDLAAMDVNQSVVGATIIGNFESNGV